MEEVRDIVKFSSLFPVRAFRVQGAGGGGDRDTHVSMMFYNYQSPPNGLVTYTPNLESKPCAFRA